jgi:hypothetical protein
VEKVEQSNKKALKKVHLNSKKDTY